MKYRVWCKNKKEYESDECFLTPDGRLFQEGVYSSMQPLSLDTHVVERHTELKGIYQSDKVIFNEKDCTEKLEGVVVWWNHGWVIQCDYLENKSCMMPFRYADNIKVIGSIHDQPKEEL